MKAQMRIPTKDEEVWFEVETHPDVIYIELNSPNIDGGSIITEMTWRQFGFFIGHLLNIAATRLLSSLK